MRILPAALAALLLSAAAAQAQSSDAGTQTSDAGTQNPVQFMAQNALADGVRTLPSGVQYKILKSGPADGPHPTPDDEVTVNYEGTLLNGQVFDSSYKGGKPITFQLKGLIQGWVDAVQKMRPGDEWILYVPPSLAYGSEQKGPIPPNSVLVFRLELVSVGGPAPQ